MFLAVVADGAIQVIVVLAFGLFWLGGIGPRDVGWRFEEPHGDVARGVLGFLLASILIFIFALAGGETVASLAEVLAMSARQRVLFTLVGVIGAITEESIYRGYLQPALMARLGAFVGIVVTALICAAAHMRFAPLAFGAKFAVGVVFGILRGRDRSLVGPGVTHTLIWAFCGSA